MTLEGAFNLNETYKRLLPGYMAEFLVFYTIYEIDKELITSLFAYQFILAAFILISGVFVGAVFYLLAFDEICPITHSTIEAHTEKLKKVIKNTGFVTPKELQDGIPTSNKVVFLEHFYRRYLDRLPDRREDEYAFLLAQYQSYAQLAFIFLTYAIVRFLLYLKFRFFDFSVELSPLTRILVLILVFFGCGGFILIADRVRNRNKGLKIEIWSRRLGLCSLIILLVLLIRIDSMTSMSQIVLLLSAAIGIIFFVNYNTCFWDAYSAIISQFEAAEKSVRREVCKALKLTETTIQLNVENF